FKQTRWYDFYRFLKEQPQRTDLTNELILFMEENDMSQSNQFTTIDVLALSNFQRARKIMDATMWEKTSEKFKRVCGSASSRKRAMAQFRDESRYVMFAAQGQGWQFEILLGFWMDGELQTAYPEVGVAVQVNPKSAARP